MSTFDLKNADCISELENTNNIPPGPISSASWLKRTDRHSPNQTVASLKVTCTSPKTANHLLCKKVFVAGQVVTVRKDLREPIRCNKCQEFGHIRLECKNTEICAHCASPSHTTTSCPPSRPPHCHSCGPESAHPSYSRKCPSFISKCESLNAKYPENSMPYFPMGKSWTWAKSPPKLSLSPPSPNPLINHPLPARPVSPQLPAPSQRVIPPPRAARPTWTTS